MNCVQTLRLILVTGLLLAACSPTPTAPNLAREWLAGRPCRPPCFLGITPGLTRYDDALKALRADPHIMNLRTYPFEEIRWRAPGSGYEDGNVQFHADTKLSKYISVYFTHRMTLDEVIRAYGTPSDVFACTFHGIDTPSITEYILELIWLDQGFSLTWFTQPGKEPVIGFDADQFRVTLFAPSFAGFADLWRFPLTTSMVKPWKGPQPFSYYATTCPLP